MEPNAQTAPGTALAFREARLPFGRALVARDGDGSLYLYGRPTPDSAPCAWRETRSGDRQWLGWDLATQNDGTSALRRMAMAARAGDAIAVLDWPIWGRDGTARDVRTPVRVRRDASGIRFEPLAHGGEPFVVGPDRIGVLLSGRLPIRLQGASVDALSVSARMLTALRDAKGVLSPGERLRAGAGLVMLGSELRERDPERRLLQRCLDRFVDAVAPMLDLHSPNRRILAIAAGAVEPLAAARPGILGPQGRAWLGGEATPALAMLEGRMKAREAERRVEEAYEPRGMAFA
jgi:hypothetical protein